MTQQQKGPGSMTGELVDKRYYQVASAGTLAERLVVAARNRIYADFERTMRPTAASTVVDVGVSDVVGVAANVLERSYPHLGRVTALGLGDAHEFQAAFPEVTYRQIEPNQPLPFADDAFDIATSNAVVEHLGSPHAQKAFVAELARIARTVFISVPHRFFPVEHHTGIPLLHWTGVGFTLACRALGKREWDDPAQLIFMTRRNLAALADGIPLHGRTVTLATTGIPLGPLSSNLYLAIA